MIKNNKKNIYIIGCGGFSKEVFYLINETEEFNVKGFVEHNPTKPFFFIDNQEIPIIDEDLFIETFKGENVVIGIGRPLIIERLTNKFKDFSFPNIIHPTFTYHKNNLNIGVGNIITAGVRFTTDITIGSFNIFNLNMTVGHDSIIGDGNVFNPSTNISGNNNIGNYNLFGVGSISLENLTIGDYNAIGASCLITKSITNNGVYIGIPYKFVRNNKQ